MENLHINVETNGNEVIIREGKALDLAHPLAINLIGTLEAPYQFFEGKKDLSELDPLKCHLLIYKDKGKISFVVNDRSAHSRCVVDGVLSPDTILKQFKINTDARWSISEFLKFIKTMRYFFANKEAHAKLVQSLQKWSVRVERVINEHNDNKGNSNFQLETKVQQSANGEDGLISKFDLLIPIFQGYPKVKFTVEIGLDPKNTTVDLFLISDELIELEIGQREKLIEDVIAKFTDFNCSKVVIS